MRLLPSFLAFPAFSALTTPPALRTLLPLLALTALQACGDPAAVPNPAWTAPVVTIGGTNGNGATRVVDNSSARELLRIRSGIAPRPRVLFSGNLAAARSDDGSQAVLPPEGDRLILLDARGGFRTTLGWDLLQRAVAVTADIPTILTDPAWLVVERDGAVYRLGVDIPPHLAFDAPFEPGIIVRFGDRYIGARSPFALTVHDHPPEAGPLLVELDSRGRITAQIDSATTTGTYAEAAMRNAGFLASNDSLVFLAGRTGSDVRAYDHEGRLRWISRRGGAAAGHANVGIVAIGERVFVLARDESGGDDTRIHALDAATGVLEQSGEIPAGPQLLTLDRRGALWSAPAADVDRLVPAQPRRELADFTLPLMDGGTFTLASLRGRVVLLNVWASWCAPCREEFPILNRLAAEMDGRDVAIVGVNEDVDAAAARRFAGELVPRFPVPMGGGRMQRTLGYRGLPYTLLLDRDGRIAARFFGFAGEAGYRQMRDAIEMELANAGSAVR